MAIENFGNNCQSTLSAGINSSVTSLTVADASTFPSVGNFRVVVDSEIMLVTAVSGTTFTVTRGQELTTAASHSSGASITAVLTAGAIQQFRADNLMKGTYASLPSAAKAGRLYNVSDGFYRMYDDGSAWTPFGPSYPLTSPGALSFSWVNQNGASLDTTRGALTLTAPASAPGHDNQHLLTLSAPATPYTITACFLNTGLCVANLSLGLGFRDSVTGKLEMLRLFAYTSVPSLAVTTFSSATAGVANTNSAGASGADNLYMWNGPIWLRINADGTNLVFSFSMNGYDFIQYLSVAKTHYLTNAPDQVFWAADANHTNYPMYVTLLSWKQT